MNATAHAAALRSGIDVIDDRIFLCRVQIRRREHQAVEIRHTVAGLDDDRRRRLPTRRGQT